MKKEDVTPHRFASLSEAHEAFGLPGPAHPLISLINNEGSQTTACLPDRPHVLSFYKISYRPKMGGRLRYGQGYYDFDEGGLLFTSPNQVIGGAGDDDRNLGACSKYTLLIHPDFFRNYPLARKIRQYGFFSYSANEALHLSDREKETMLAIFRIIEEELNSRIDEFSQDVVVSQVELLLNYANRFYKRQFLTRKSASSDLLQQLEAFLDDYFDGDQSLERGLPSVQALAAHLNVSPSYLSDMLRALTGQNAQQHIHEKLIERAKQLLSTTSLTVAQIAWQLGFEHSQSFSKLFKAKTAVSPIAFRQSFAGA